MHVQIQMLNNSALKQGDKIEETNTELDSHGITHCLCFPTIPHPTILWHSREVPREQRKLQPIGAGKGDKDEDTWWEDSTPHHTNPELYREGRLSFLQTNQSIRRKKMSVFLIFFSRKVSAVWNYPVCMLYPWPHPKYIFLGRHSLGQRASRIQCLAQRGSILGGLLRTTINTISNNNPLLSYGRYF